MYKLKRMLRSSLFIAIISFSFITCGQTSTSKNEDKTEYKFKLSNAEWKEKLTPEQYYILREKGTERAFTGEYWNNKKEGKYTCSGCDQLLFHSNTKFKSGTGWPSFYTCVDNSIDQGVDYDLGYSRNEIHCSNCGGHLGHVFEDGPAPTGLRYCINSASLIFEEKEK